MPQFEMTVEPFDEGVNVEINGELDITCAYTFDSKLREVEEREPRTLLIDVRGLEFIDSAGMARILAAHRRARRAGRRLVLTRGSRSVQRVLSLAALDDVLEIVPEPNTLLT